MIARKTRTNLTSKNGESNKTTSEKRKFIPKKPEKTDSLYTFFVFCFFLDHQIPRIYSIKKIYGGSQQKKFFIQISVSFCRYDGYFTNDYIQFEEKYINIAIYIEFNWKHCRIRQCQSNIF